MSLAVARLFRLLSLLGCLALAAIFALYLLEIGLRYVFNRPTSWSVDLITYLLPAVIFLPLPEVTRRGAHISIPILLEVLPARALTDVRRIGAIVSLGVLLLIVYVTGFDFLRLLSTGEETSGVTPVPKWWVMAPVVLGLGLSVVGLLFPGPELSDPGRQEPRPDGEDHTP